MDGHGSNHKYKFLKICEDRKMKVVGMPLSTIHFLQLLDIYVFQPLKIWHSEALNETVQNGNEIFSKVELPNAFNNFHRKAFKKLTICSTWKKTILILYNTTLIIGKARKRLLFICNIILFPPN